MMEIESKRMTKIIAISGSIAMAIFLYMVTSFFRLEWVRYDVVDRSWQVESMLCGKRSPALVIRFYKEDDAEADFPIRFSQALYQHLNQQQNKTVAVERKLTGYLREWDYGLIQPITVARKDISKHAYIPQQQYLDCEFKIAESLTQKVTDTRRKMR